MAANRQIWSAFRHLIGRKLRSDFSDYDPGQERKFISDTVGLLDNIILKGGGQLLKVKAKNIDRSPLVNFRFPRGINMPEMSKSHTRELADILFVANFFKQGNVSNRQALITQSKCMTDSDFGSIDWKIDLYQFVLLDSLPEFQLDYKNSNRKFNFSAFSSNLFDYSFVSNHHRPFFYKTRLMANYMSQVSGGKSATFRQGRNPIPGIHLMLTKLLEILNRNYGESFTQGSETYSLIEEIYNNASLSSSSSPNVLPDGGTNQEEYPGAAIVQFDIDLDGNEEPNFDEWDEGGLRL